jgi:hypothetical protein
VTPVVTEEAYDYAKGPEPEEAAVV